MLNRVLKRKNGRYQMCNQEHESKEEQKIQWIPKEKGQAIIDKTQHRKISVERHEP
jgi:hypothetical protein